MIEWKPAPPPFDRPVLVTNGKLAMVVIVEKQSWGTSAYPCGVDGYEWESELTLDNIRYWAELGVLP